jgi:AcrR family transcriptional regulator
VRVTAAPTKKAAQSEATRSELIAVATEIFTRDGYAAASIEEIVRRAGVTRGALYYHYASKQDLFRAVFDEVERDLAIQVVGAASAQPDALSRLRAGLIITLRASLEPTVRQVVLKDGTSVLGWLESRAIMERYALGGLKGGLALCIQDGQLRPLPVDALAHLLLGALMEGAALVAFSPRPESALPPVEESLIALLDSLRP